MDLCIEVAGSAGEAELRALFHWLSRDDDLRMARIGWTPVQPGPEEMGALSDVLVVSLGAGGAGVALVQSLTTWLRSRGSDVRLKIRGPHGEMDVDAKRVRDLEGFVARFESIMRE